MSMRKRIALSTLVILLLSSLLVACGQKTAEDIISKIEKTIASMDDYKADAQMLMKTGQEEHTYNVSILHKKDDYYRVTLHRPDDEKNNQEIVKNDDGVFVITPTLNKSYKFQTDWPENSSQPYLYESLLYDINEDQDREFEEVDDYYIFRTKTNYQSNKNLPFQEIYFDKKTFAPTHVNVLDRDHKTLVHVQFTHFSANNQLTADDFTVDYEEKNTEQTLAGDEDGIDDPFTIIFPLYTAGAELYEMKEVSLEESDRVIMTFQGDKNFTLVQEKQHAAPVSISETEAGGDL